MSRASTRGILVGWALGALDGGLALPGLVQYAGSPWFFAMAFVVPMMLYGWGGWLLGKLSFRMPLPWNLAYFVGAVIIVHIRRSSYILEESWEWVAIGGALSVLIWSFSRGTEYAAEDVEEGEAAGHARSLGTALCAVLGLFALARIRFYFDSQPQERGSSRFDLGAGIDPGTDWVWLVAAIALLVPIVRAARAPRPRRGAGWVPRASAALVLLPPASYFYLNAQFDHEPVVTEVEGARAPAEDAPSVVLLSWDTVRADSLTIFGGGGLDMPHLERLAEQSIVFDNYHAVAPITGPSHNSMLSGLYPPNHGLRENSHAVQTRADAAQLPLRLPEVFQANGYRTAAFVSAVPVRRDYRFHAGFHHFDDRADLSWKSPIVHALGFAREVTIVGIRLLPNDLAFATATTPGRVTTARAVEWLGEQNGPTFSWVHLFDAHDPRDLVDEHWEPVQARAEEGPHAANPECEESWVQQRAEISLLDENLGTLLEALEAKDPGLENTILVLAADHGECFGEGADEGIFGEGGIRVLHAPSLFEATQHVVGLVKPPASAGLAPRRVSVDASHVDLMPTILELAGLPRVDDLDGASLVRAMDTGSAPARPIYLEAWSRSNLNKLKGVLHEDWKYVRTEDGDHEFLYRIERGKAGSRADFQDLASTEPEKLAELSALLAGIEAEFQPIDPLAGSGDDAALAQLGYTENDVEGDEADAGSGD